MSAIDFINKTKIDTPQAEEPVKPQLTAEEQRSQKERRLLQAVIAVIAVSCAAMLVYVVYTVYQLLN